MTHTVLQTGKNTYSTTSCAGVARGRYVAKRVLRPILIALLVSKEVYITVPYTSSELISHGDCQQPHTTWFGKQYYTPGDH